MSRYTYLLLSAVILFSACNAGQKPEPPTVFRSVLDEQPRMLTLKLQEGLWAAYSAENGSLHRLWQDGVDLDGAVYTTAHGPQPTSVGPAYFVNEAFADYWQLTRNGAVEPINVQFKGHSFENGQTKIHVQLTTSAGEQITVTEQPTSVQDASGNVGLQRAFETSGVPDGASLSLQVDLNSLIADAAYTTENNFTINEESTSSASGILELTSNGSTLFTSYFDAPAVRDESNDDASQKPAGLALIERSDCVACHNAEVQTVGPSYTAIANRYENNDLTVVRLANKVINGGSGVWGEALMTPHPTLSTEDAKEMVNYIMSLGDGPIASGGPLDVGYDPVDFTDQRDGSNGLSINMYPILTPSSTIDDLGVSEQPYYSGTISAVHAPNEGYMGPVPTNFYVEIQGFLNIQESDNYVLRLISDDGSKLYLDGELLIDNDGLHGVEARDSELILDAGSYPIRLAFFQSGGGAALSLQWARHGDNKFSVIPSEVFTFNQEDLKEAVDYAVLMGVEEKISGDQEALSDVHPSFSVETIRPESFQPKVGGLDVLDDGRVVVSTWDAEGGVYVLSNIEQGNPELIEVKQIASGLAEPLGLKVVDGDIYVLQKQELTRLVDNDGDEITDFYETVANDWGVTSNFHEFAFGLEYKEGYFYAALATAILPGGASANPQNPDRGTVIKISKDTGDVEIIARGLRTPNGIGLGIDNEIFVADNQGDWLPASKIVHIQEGEFYGSRSVEFPGSSTLAEKKPVSWLPQDEIGNSPSQPVLINVGPYQNQMIHGEVTHGGIKRVFVEEINGQLQGALFRFTQGLEAGVNRLVWGPDGKLYIGGVGNPGNWGHAGKLMYGLQRMTYTGNPVFEMLAVRAQDNGFEIEFTEPLASNVGASPEDYEVWQWIYVPTADYGGPKVNEEELTISDIQISEDRKRVNLTMDGLKAGHMVYFRLNIDTFKSEEDRALWSTEAWYTLNELPVAATGD